MKKYIIILIIALVSSYTFAQETDAVFKNISKEYIMHTDGSLEYTYSKVLQLNSQYAFNRLYGETFVVYNPDFQKVKINKAYTIMANGRKVEVPENAYNKVLPRAASNYPAYNQMVELVITHTGLEVGATIYLDYSIISKPGFIKEMLGSEVLEERVPVENYNIVLKVPARRNLKFNLYNSDIKPTEKNDGKYRTYAWSLKNLKAQSYEQSSPSSFQTAPTLKFSTFPDSKTELSAFVSQKAFEMNKDENLQKFIDATKKETFSSQELAFNIQKYIVNNIATNHIPLAWHNYQLRTPSQVWNSNVGGDVEKTVLLWNTLKNAGLNANLVGFYPLSLWQGQQTSLDDFSGMGVHINFKNGDRVILSATSINQKTLEFSYPNHVIINLLKGNTVNPVSLNTNTSIHMNTKINLDAGNKIYGHVDLKLSGAALNQIQLKQDTQKILNSFNHALPFDKDVKAKATFADSYNGKFSLEVKGKSNLKQQENYYFWTLPSVNNGIESNRFNELPKLRESSFICPAIAEEYNFNVILTKSVEWVGQEIHIAYKESFGEMRIDIAMKDGQLVINKYLNIYPDNISILMAASRMDVHSREFKATKRTLSLKEYAIFRKMMIDWNSDRVNELVFKR